VVHVARADRPTLPDPGSDQGKARSRADLTALDSLFLQELADLLGELPESTRMALLYGCHRQGHVECCPVYRTQPGSTSLTCGGPDLLRRHPATRLIEPGP
jgi:hypothetical protein